MGTDYSAPFAESIELKPGASKITGYDAKKFLLSMKCPFIWVSSSIKTSGSGEDDPCGSEVKQFCQKPRRDANGNMVALGDIIGYTFKHYKGIEGVWDYVADTAVEAFASKWTMLH